MGAFLVRWTVVKPFTLDVSLGMAIAKDPNHARLDRELLDA